METLRLVLLFVHILGYAALLGGLLVQVRDDDKRVNSLMRGVPERAVELLLGHVVGERHRGQRSDDRDHGDLGDLGRVGEGLEVLGGGQRLPRAVRGDDDVHHESPLGVRETVPGRGRDAPPKSCSAR